VADASAVAHYASAVPDFAQRLMQAFWPGPLTLILPRRPGVANAAAGGNPTIGLRSPSHPVAQVLLKALINGGQIPINLQMERVVTKQLESDPHYLDCRAALAMTVPNDVAVNVNETGQSRPSRVWGLAAPSANQFGRVSPTTAAHVQGEFGDELLILDGGACSVGIESTIIDCTRGMPVLLRPGAITPEQIQAVCGLKVLLKDELTAQATPAPKASGTLESHYAPKARVRLMSAPEIQAALQTEAVAADVAVWHRSPLEGCAIGVLAKFMPAEPALAARQLFAVLRAFDLQGVTQIWVELPPDAPAWDGVRDRLQRAAH
jgi:L-threonylcarbamoyladenylate synthase